MPVRHLDAYLTDRQQVHTLPLSALTETRLGIDASLYLARLLQNPKTREPFLPATGGLPLSLTQRIETDLRILEKLRIKPVFVFPGIWPNSAKKGAPGKYPNQAVHFSPLVNAAQFDMMRARSEAWDLYEKGKVAEATTAFETKPASHVVQWDLWRAVLRIFRHRNVDFMIAPYTASAQLIYLYRHPKSYVHAIWGATETLLYNGVDKLILSVMFGSQTFAYCTKSAILADMNLTPTQFLDVGVLAGFDDLIAPPFPPTQNDMTLKPVLDMVKFYKSGHAAASAFFHDPQVKATQYIDTFARARAIITFALVLSSDGVVAPLTLTQSPTNPATPAKNADPSVAPQVTTAADLPQDLHDIFTHRLPDEVYYYLSRGLVSPQPLNWLTSGHISEPPPLDNGENSEYRRFVKEVISEGATCPRAVSLALLSSSINSWWASRKVTSSYWYDAAVPPQPGRHDKFVPHSGKDTLMQIERCVTWWNVPNFIVEEELRRQNSSTIDFQLCLGATSQEKLAGRTRAKANHAHPLDKKDEVVANVVWRFLELRGFLSSATHMHTPLGRSMHSSLKASRVNDKFQEPLYLFLELVRAGVMHGNLWSGRAYSGGPSFGDEAEKRSMLLVMRVLSIVPLNFKQEPWKGPLSRELLVFNSFLHSLSRALRSLVELTAMNMLLHGDARRARDDLLDIALSLPFQADVNTGFGILGKTYLDALVALKGGRVEESEKDDEEVKEAKEQALNICDENFDNIKSPSSEVERGFRFWDAAYAAIKSLEAANEAVSPELVSEFDAAQAWLHPMRP
ncbi:XPG I-region protein [Dacryopinax primogenitus]|uniref:XPG I-region protein n=1 Tax=Dacryopinax primogenitus (strain DJM 731) TaxID=1858805 RepID=M5G010_DACPD|nr:XPG I-region protein [Dacryopinax primogenitus]EJU03601.1 XPG I-region protein [Dacryopinax primogenitus]